MEFNQIDFVEVKITFNDGTSKIYDENDIEGDFSDWLSDINYNKKESEAV